MGHPEVPGCSNHSPGISYMKPPSFQLLQRALDEIPRSSFSLLQFALDSQQGSSDLVASMSAKVTRGLAPRDCRALIPPPPSFLPPPHPRGVAGNPGRNPGLSADGEQAGQLDDRVRRPVCERGLPEVSEEDL